MTFKDCLIADERQVWLVRLASESISPASLLESAERKGEGERDEQQKNKHKNTQIQSHDTITVNP